MVEKQITLKKAITLSGTGLHTGAKVNLTIHPAPVNHGYKFKRIDLEDQPIIDALADNVTMTQRGTVLAKGDATISTIEHCLSALSASKIDNCLIEVDGPEAPILDGSAKFFIEAIKEVGTEEQGEEKKYFVVKEKMVYENEELGIKIVALPDDEFSADVKISFDKSLTLSNQYATLDSLDDYEKEISACRTFVFLHELEPLLKNNLIKGGDLDNAIIIIDKEISQEELDKLADLFNKPRVEVQPTGILNNVDLVYSNEPARHKLLDVIGDLALCGMPIKGRIMATRPGHMANVEFAKIIRKEIKKRSLRPEVPCYDTCKEAIYDINDIKKMLPHRPPFLLVDKIIELNEKSIVGIKNVTMNEPFFVGHFPDEPVMPAVLQIEAMAQTGGIFVLSKLDEPSAYSTYFVKIDNVKLRRKVIPGDTLIFKLELLSEFRRGMANMKGTAFVGNTIVSEGEFVAQVVKNKDIK
ncbi:bifunctional UDP-3-O-[3-hydroxymyristoyl] N-acetylglucosamine deacetylase/3-hydroxyacyl-ACP dehydratase [Carboxylicivirga linearis]|uniref:Multifunctional fusion protein n=1 Tax=Carboxylicivirga linearis TaxID=1628157 RepID=A0ABS5JSD3_9BACT|nr:bifunctional UDP-3-O-[3-hydroxymyristoyl] N-acetylglucosamine deacetylase/3-hydroxyacyl-ACP dehydratase [Carboxylicivirga linearis]MBS2097757.1 bifunctional UDP-3-O-[3-hydroxymyristoyl] N-acetylglucosamine deacetylase/3-hydroxyacyl-ACP dehydratase [Carboxylicivirga linearis]